MNIETPQRLPSHVNAWSRWLYTFGGLLLATAFTQVSCSSTRSQPQASQLEDTNRASAASGDEDAQGDVTNAAVTDDAGSAHAHPAQTAEDEQEGGTEGAAQVTAPAGPAGFPIRWTSSIELGSLADIPQELRRVHPSGLGKVHLWGQPGTKVTVTSCKQSFELHPRGYEEVLPFTFKGDPYLPRCRTLALLGKARPSRASAFDDFDIARPDFNRLPVGLATAFSPSRCQEQELLAKRGGRWAEFVPEVLRGPDRRFRPNTFFAREPYNTVAVEHLANADFNHDGFEDLLLYVLNHAEGGTAFYERLVALTARGDPSRWEILFEEEGRGN